MNCSGSGLAVVDDGVVARDLESKKTMMGSKRLSRNAHNNRYLLISRDSCYFLGQAKSTT